MSVRVLGYLLVLRGICVDGPTYFLAKALLPSMEVICWCGSRCQKICQAFCLVERYIWLLRVVMKPDLFFLRQYSKRDLLNKAREVKARKISQAF